MLTLTQTEYRFMRKILDRKRSPSDEEFKRAIHTLANIQLMSIQPREDAVNFEWSNKAMTFTNEGGTPKVNYIDYQHHYCVNNAAIFLFSNVTDMHRFAMEMLHWTEEEIKNDIPLIDKGFLSEACDFGKMNGDLTVLIDYQMDPKKGFFGYNTLMEAWTVYQR